MPMPVLPPSQIDHDDPDEATGSVEDIGDDNDAAGADHTVEDTDDGGAIITMEPGTEVERDPEFYSNLAEDLDDQKARELGMSLSELVEEDKKAREKLDEMYSEGIQRTGIAEPAPGGASFQGATKVTHPVLMEACVDFESRIIKEIMPAKGPVKSHIPGRVTPEKEEKADRKTKYMNWQLTQQIPNFRPELEQCLIQTPIGGTGFIKWSWDQERKRPLPVFVPMDQIHLPAAANSYWSARRKTHAFTITELEFNERRASGMYIDRTPMPAPGLVPEQSMSKTTADKAQGLEASPDNIDGLRELYEIYVWLALEIDNEGDDETTWRARPYIVTVDSDTNDVLALYRNWVEDDDTFEEIEWLNYFGMIPWTGPFSVGFTHMLGGLAGAATGSLRALLDAAMKANSNTAFKLDGEASGQNVTVDQNGMTSVRGSNLIDDVRKVFLPNPFPGPSAVLFSLLQAITAEAKGVVQMTFEKTADQAQNIPVGTIMAQIEQGMATFSAIHARMHYSMGRLLKTVHTINRLHLDETDVFDDTGEIMVKRADFEGPMDVVPVSDPNIFSEVQRTLQAQAVVQRSDAKPGLYDPRKVEEMFLKSMRIPDGDALLVEKPEPKELNAVLENMAATGGRPINAFPKQDHLAHLQTHLDFIASPFFGMSQLMAATALPILIQHVREHQTFWYIDRVSTIADETVGEEDMNEARKSAEMGETRALDRFLAAASGKVIQEEAPEVLASIPAILQRAQQLLQSMQPPNPLAQAGQAQMAEVQRKTQADQQSNVISMQDLQNKKQATDAKIATDQASLQVKQDELGLKRDEVQQQSTQKATELAFAADQAEKGRQMTAAEIAADGEAAQTRADAELERQRMGDATRLHIASQNDETAVQLALMNAAEGEKTRLSDGDGIPQIASP